MTRKRRKPTGQRARPDAWRGAFLIALSGNGNVTGACVAAKIDRTSVYDARKNDPTFAAQWDEALEIAKDVLEAEAWRRAVQGTEEPIYQKGQLVGTVQRYSDQLLITLLKAHNPQRYKEKFDATIVVTPEQMIILQRLGLTPQQAWLMLFQEIAQDLFEDQAVLTDGTIDTYASTE